MPATPAQIISSFSKRLAYVAPRTVVTLTLAPVSQPHRDRLKEIANVYGYGRHRGELPAVGIDEVVRDAPPVSLREISRGAWGVSDFELIALNQIAAAVRPRRVFEFGTFDGRTTLNLAANTPDECEVVTLDLPPGTQELPGATVGQRYKGSGMEPKIRQVFGNSQSMDFAEFEGTVDMVFIDASHIYAHVKKDQETALRLLRRDGDGRPRGVLLWHDYERHLDVTRAVDEFAREHPGLGRCFRIDRSSLACCWAL